MSQTTLEQGTPHNAHIGPYIELVSLHPYGAGMDFSNPLLTLKWL